MIKVQQRDGVTVLALCSGKVNAMDVEMLTDLADCLADLQAAGPGPVVLTGEGQVFSAGVDLRRVLDGGSAYIDRLIPALSAAFMAVFCFPAPTVAAVNGAAVAGGCVLACACDYRVAAADAPIGATELSVGVPFPTAGLEVMRYACGDLADAVIFDSGLHQGEHAVSRRLAHAVVTDDVVGHAISVASKMRFSPAYSVTKRQLRQPFLDRVEAADDEVVCRIWSSAATAGLLRAQLQRIRQERQ
jgi:enoyl-CoA hydratase